MKMIKDIPRPEAANGATEALEKLVKFIKQKAYTGNYEDGKIFITPIDDAYAIRIGVPGL
jgi:nitrogen regulatory protein PII 1